MRPSATLLALSALLGAGVAVLPASAAATRPVTVAQYGFTGFTARSSTVPDDTGNGHTMRLVSSGGGKVKPVVHGSGRGLQFPAKCGGAKCPHAVLQSPHSARLNPGSRNLTFGATVRLARSQTTKGQNVVQKGYSATSSQYKLQIDGSAGRPSCVLVDVRKKGIRQVISAVSVADGRWHIVKCQRAGTAFRVLVDGRVRGLAKVPAGLSVANSYPVSIGGKGAYRDNDQFNGAVDDVFIRIG